MMVANWVARSMPSTPPIRAAARATNSICAEVAFGLMNRWYRSREDEVATMNKMASHVLTSAVKMAARLSAPIATGSSASKTVGSTTFALAMSG